MQYVHMQMSSQMKASDIGEIYIYGVIYPYKYDVTVTAKEIVSALDKVADAKTLHVHINSPGGVITEAVDMMGKLEEHKAKNKEIFISMCDSAATLIALISGAVVSMYEGGEYMIHRPTSGYIGNADEMQNEVDALRKKEKEFCAMYARRCKKPESDVWAKMKKETWFTAQEALDYGLVDRIIKPNDDKKAAMYSKGQMMMLGYRNVPDWVMNRLGEVGEDTSSGADAPPSPQGEGFLPEMEGAGEGTQGEGSNGENAALAVLSNKTNEEEPNMATMSAEELRKQNPEAVAEIENAARMDGEKKERARMQALDEVALPGFEQMVKDAKYGEKTMTAEEVSMQIVRQQMAKGPAFIAARKAETQKMAEVPGDPPPEKPADAAEMDKMAEMCAGLAPDRSTVRKD